MTMENDLVDKWLLDFCAEVSPYLKATSPRKGVYRVESNGGVAVEFAYNFSNKAALDHTKNVLLGVFGNRIQALEADLARKTEGLKTRDEFLAFVARWAWEKDGVSVEELFGAIKFYPPIKDIADQNRARAAGVSKP